MSEHNIVRITPFLRTTDIPLFFGDESVDYTTNNKDMYDTLVACQLFPSKSEAKKNWVRTGKDAPSGFTGIEGIGKLKHRFTILNMGKEY